MSPYIERHLPVHRCAPPDAPRRHDTWSCPECQALYYCSGWVTDWGISQPWWHRVPRSRWLSARWIRRLLAVFVSPPC